MFAPPPEKKINLQNVIEGKNSSSSPSKMRIVNESISNFLLHNEAIWILSLSPDNHNALVDFDA